MTLGTAGSSMSFRLLELLKLSLGYWEALDIHALSAGMAVMVEVSHPPTPPPSWMAAGPSTVSLSCLSLRMAVTFGVMTEESRRHSDHLIHQGAAENKTPKTQAYTQTNKALDQQEGPEGVLCLPSCGGKRGGAWACPIFLGSCIIKSCSNTTVYLEVLCKAQDHGYYRTGF